MRLTIVTHKVSRGDGQGRVNYEIARHALRQGVRVRLLADRVDADLLEAGADWVEVHPPIQRVMLFKVRLAVGMADRALDAIRDQGDIIHANGYGTTRPHQINTAHFVHNAWRRSPVHAFRVRRDLNGLYQWLFSALNTRWERLAFREARIVVAVSQLVHRQLMEAGVPKERIRVVLNGVDLREFRPGRMPRGALGLPEGVPLALFVGEIRTPRKNPDTVLRALDQAPGLHLAVVGATQGSPYPAMATQLGLADRVHFLGFRRDIPEIMRAADMFVFPSRYEACSLVLLEALASGLPVLTASTAGGAEVITPECGLVLSNPNDADGLGKTMRLLAEDRGRRRCMATAARSIAEGYSWTRMAESYLQLYEETSAG